MAAQGSGVVGLAAMLVTMAALFMSTVLASSTAAGIISGSAAWQAQAMGATAVYVLAGAAGLQVVALVAYLWIDATQFKAKGRVTT